MLLTQPQKKGALISDSMLQVVSWVLGEFGHFAKDMTRIDIIEVLVQVIIDPSFFSEIVSASRKARRP